MIFSGVRSPISAPASRMVGAYLTNSLEQQVATLLASLSEGVWLDPRDAATRYREHTGITPTTAAGQQVGLLLDRRLGLMRGMELVPTSDFSSAAWIKAAGVTAPGGIATFSAVTSGAALYAVTGVTGVVGVLHEVTFRISSRSAGSIGVRLASRGDAAAARYSQVGTYTYLYSVGAADQTNKNIVFDAASFTGTVDYISVKELPGNHASQPTTTARPIYQTSPARLVFDGIDDVLTVTLGAAYSSATIIDCPLAGPVAYSGLNLVGTHVINTTTCGRIILPGTPTDAELELYLQFFEQTSGIPRQ